MTDLLINLLTPILAPLGVSAADVNIYVNLVSGYLYVILIGLLVMAAVMVAAHFVLKKGDRHVARWTAAIAWVLVVLVTVNTICFGPLYATLSSVMNTTKVEMSDDVVGNSVATTAAVGEEGIVLVKNEGLLPLDPGTTKLNLFGWASVSPVYSGTGSATAGEITLAPVSTMKSLADAGYDLNTELSQLYLNYGKFKGFRPDITMGSQDWTLPEPPRSSYTTELMNGAASFSDTAIIVLGRSGGENADLPTDMNSVIKGTYNIADTDLVPAAYKGNYNYSRATYQNNGDYDDFEPGEHYLELSRTEEDLVELVCSSFQKVIVIVNTNNAMELDWVDKYPSIGAVLLVPGTGNAGMAALGKIVNGTLNPSGKTVDTYLKDLTLAPTWNHSGNSGYNFLTGTDDLVRRIGRLDPSFQGTFSRTDYVEGIYMGYKFYETAAEEGLIDYDEYVQYPFGYGLSFTSFKQEITSFKQDANSLTVEVTVTNTGSMAGKDVVELYFTPPYNNGGIEKASVNLLDFEKTGLLEPNTSEKITLTLPMENLASFDSGRIKTANGGYILEAGEYTVSIRSDSHTVLDSRSFTLGADIDYSADGRPSDGQAAVNQFEYAESDWTVLSRKDKFANYAAATAAPTADMLALSKDLGNAILEWSVSWYDGSQHDNADDVMPTTGASNGLKLADLTGKDYDDPMWDQLLDQMTVEDMENLINHGGWQTVAIDSVGKIATSDFDGPSGYSNYITKAMGTSFTTEPLTAQTWNKELAEKVGEAIAQEFASANAFGWYGPAVNLHRTAFGGRNYEYFSEDGTLSGIMASCEINGAAKFGVYSYMKHFAVNDQETNRNAFLCTFLPEQTLRENVLKPFETVVKNFDFDHYAMAAMSSYNLIGTVPAVSNYQLLTTVLRDEWGFKGMVVSDYDGSYGYMITDAAIRAGNDLMLGTGVADSNKITDINAPTCVLAMRQACKNILYTVGNSGYYAGEGDVDTGSADKMTTTFIIVDVIVAAAAVAIEAVVLLRWMKKRRNEKS